MLFENSKLFLKFVVMMKVLLSVKVLEGFLCHLQSKMNECQKIKGKALPICTCNFNSQTIFEIFVMLE